MTSHSSQKKRTRSSNASAENNGRATDAGSRDQNSSRVFCELRKSIVHGQLAPGSRIAERTVADRFGVSRTPVANAIRRLQQEGFVTTAGKHGERLIVAPMTQEDARELYLMAGHFEGLAAHMAALLPAATRRRLVTQLRAANRALAVAVREGSDASQVFALDFEFHRLFVEAVAGPRMLAMHRTIMPQIERYARAYIGLLIFELRNSVGEHNAIIEGIHKGAPRAAQRSAEHNWYQATDRLLHKIAQYGERGCWYAVPT